MAALPDHIEISKQTIRDHAMAFSKKWADATSEAAERQLFWNDFFAIFGVSLRNVGFFEVAAKRLSTQGQGWIDLLVPGRMAVEHKSAGKDLDQAMDQLVDYLDSLQSAAMPRILVACNFQEFYWQDLETHTEGRFALEDLSKNVELFWWLSGHGHHEMFEDEEEANLVATGYMATLHDAVRASGYDDHSLREWLTRILFCLFADDTEVWDRNAFSNYLFLNTRPDGSDLGQALGYLFQILNTPEDKRANNLDEDLATFTYINGNLFDTVLPIPSCDESTRDALLEACKFNWSAISPAIFGSMFQNVMTPAERRHLGAHYTTEENILKTIRPLFLDDLESELEKIKVTSSQQSRQALNAFHEKLARLTFLDPACGCGNFLVIAYRELRRLETELLRKQAAREGKDAWQAMGLSLLCKVTVGQFYGIELEEFPARIARTALYLMDHKANLDVSKEFGQYFARFPIPTSPHIANDNALRLDWNEVLPAEMADYVFGNPPFVGKQQRNAEQQKDMKLIFDDEKGTGVLDYVAAWYRRAVEYVGSNPIQAAFVSTNSITQGEQVPALWRQILRAGFEITFAHRTFAWTSEARGKAHVHCVIIGFAPVGVRGKPKELFDYPDISAPPLPERARQINPYLADAPTVIIERRSSPLDSAIPPAVYGSMPNDGGHLLLSEEEAASVMSGPGADAIAARYLRPLLSAQDLLNGGRRWCLWLRDSTAAERATSPLILDRLRQVCDHRERSQRQATRRLASMPYLFGEDRQPHEEYLCLPRVSSIRRRVVPMAWLSSEIVANDQCIMIPNAPLWLFGVLQSGMFMSWLRAVGGRLKSDYRLSAELVYNTFPFPAMSSGQRSGVEAGAQRVLDAISTEPGSTLADLYNPLAMPASLVAAHDELDRLVDTLFALRKKFKTEADRLSVLFERYEALTSPLLARGK
jgi:hypothetical protein